MSASLRVQLDGTDVTVIELAPPAVETPLLRGEFAEEMTRRCSPDTRSLASRAVNWKSAMALLKAMSRIAPQFMLKQMAKMTKPENARPPINGVRPHSNRCETSALR
jgi:uncharacterized oxidoreductase